MTHELDKAVTLAICYDGGLRQDGMFLFVNQERFWHFCQAYRHQVIEELANKPGVMLAAFGNYFDGEYVPIAQVREAIATMQAKVEQANRMFDRLNQIAGENERKLEQAQARVAELEKDAARVREMLRQLEITSSGMSYGDDKRGGASDYTRGWKDCLAAFKRETLAAKQTDIAIDAAMKGQQP